MQTPANDRTEERLLAEIEDLKRQLHAQQHSGRRKPARPSAATLWVLAILAVIILGGAFLAGYIPEINRQTALAKEAREDTTALPPVNVAAVEQAPGKSQLVLPGNIQAVTEAPVLARASGYIRNRMVDIGDRVKEGQLLAEIEAPELDHQVQQAKASVEQAKSALEEAEASLQQGRTNRDIARLTYDRYNALIAKGAVARQDVDTFKAQFEAAEANVVALEKAGSMARNNITGAQANEKRVEELQSYLRVRAPFAGVITLRNVDTGALVAEGQTLLFRIAQTDRLRTYVNVPQADSTTIRAGQPAQLKIPDLPLKTFKGTVTRTANALDPATRTLLAEVQVVNTDGFLLPGMYSEVNFTTPRLEPPMMIRADALVVRGDGPHVAVVGSDNVVHFRTVVVGRDYGDRLEILGGIEKGQQVVVSPGDVVRENVKVRPVLVGARSKE
jgi:RND family efflux transporter MFP subunit